MDREGGRNRQHPSLTECKNCPSLDRSPSVKIPEMTSARPYDDDETTVLPPIMVDDDARPSCAPNSSSNHASTTTDSMTDNASLLVNSKEVTGDPTAVESIVTAEREVGIPFHDRIQGESKLALRHA